MRRASRSTWLACALLIAQRAHAHPAAAEPPIFGNEPCVSVLDGSSTELWSSPYMVAYDDTQLEDGDIRLPDAKTHQFFALRGAVVASATGFELVPFEPAGEQAAEDRIPLPLWINAHDVERAAASVEGSGTTFMASEVPPDLILDSQAALAGRALRVDADDARRPITHASAERGITFAPASLPAGVYTIAAYIFSPPYNGWAPKPGLINVVSAEHHAPAAELQSIAGVVRSFQGRRVRACTDAPEGTTVRGSFRFIERPELGWQEWLAEQPLPSAGDIEHCFKVPAAQLAGSLRIRLELRAPDGTITAAYSPDTLTTFAGTGACEPSDVICCPTPDAPDAGADAPSAMPASCTTSRGSSAPAWLLIVLALAFTRRARRRS